MVVCGGCSVCVFFGRFRGCFWSFLVFFWFFSSGRFRVFRSFFVVFMVVSDFFARFFVFFVFRCFRWFATFSKALRFRSFFPRVLLQKSRHAICKILNLQNAIFSRQIAFSRRRCLFQNFEHAISTRGHAFFKISSEMQNLAGISVILPRPRFVQKFASAIFSWQIAFERRGRLVAKNFEHAIFPRSFGSFAQGHVFS